jgi:glutamate dehydrogenase
VPSGAIDAQQRFMQWLEAKGKLDRKIEGLPDDLKLAEMKAGGQALTRPELAVLTAYSKLELFDDIVASTAPDDAFFKQTLVSYFPAPLAKYEVDMQRHRLRREIISTVLANDIINMCGPTFPQRLRLSAQCDTGSMVIAFEVARQVFRLDEAWDQVSALDGQVPAEAQIALYQEISTVLRRQTSWFARRAMQSGVTVDGLINAYRPVADVLRPAGASVLSRFEQGRFDDRIQAFTTLGASPEMARDFAMLRPLVATADIGDLAREAGWPETEMAMLYHQVGATFDFDRLRAAAGTVQSTDHYDRLAVRRLIEDLMTEQLALTRAVAKTSSVKVGASEEAAEQAIDAWIGPKLATVEGLRASVDEIEASGSGWTFAKLSIASGQFRAVDHNTA